MKSKDKHWQSSGRQGLPKGEWDLSSILVLACWLPGCRSRLNHHCLIFKSDIHWILIIWLKEAEDINCVFSNLPSLFKGTIQPTLYWPWVISNSLWQLRIWPLVVYRKICLSQSWRSSPTSLTHRKKQRMSIPWDVLQSPHFLILTLSYQPVVNLDRQAKTGEEPPPPKNK